MSNDTAEDVSPFFVNGTLYCGGATSTSSERLDQVNDTSAWGSATLSPPESPGTKAYGFDSTAHSHMSFIELDDSKDDEEEDPMEDFGEDGAEVMDFVFREEACQVAPAQTPAQTTPALPLSRQQSQPLMLDTAWGMVSVHPEVQVSTSGQRFQFRTGVLNTGKWLGNGYTSDCSGSDCWSDSSGFSQSSNSSHG